MDEIRNMGIEGLLELNREVLTEEELEGLLINGYVTFIESLGYSYVINPGFIWYAVTICDTEEFGDFVIDVYSKYMLF